MKQRTLFIFSGPPGSGKGSLSQLCVNRLGYKQVSTGDLCRKEIAKSSEIGEKIDFLIKSGRLIPDGLITQMVYDWFKEQPDDGAPVILDGFPRTVRQAELLHELDTDGKLALEPVVVDLKLDDETIVRRLSSRLVCMNKRCQAIYSSDPSANMMPERDRVCDRCEGPVGQRPDDRPEVIRERLKVYHEHAKPLLDFYKKAGYTIIELNADQPLADLFDQFEHAVRT